VSSNCDRDSGFLINRIGAPMQFAQDQKMGFIRMQMKAEAFIFLAISEDNQTC
jgi:hypothetical protein